MTKQALRSPKLAPLGAMLLSLVPSLASAETLTLTSRVDQVTVFPQAASIHRTARAQLRAGEHQLVFAALPAALSDDSLRVTGFGPGVTAEAVTVRAGRMGETMVAELEQLNSALSITDQALAAAAVQLAAATQTRDQLAAHNGLPADRARAANAVRQTGEQLEVLQRRRATEATALNQANARAATPVKFVTVEVTAAREGDLEVGIEYLVSNVATWRPAYSAYLRSDLGHVGLDVFAALQQTTGEDWINVRMSVSTVTPATTLSLPTQSEWALSLEPEPEPTPPMTVQGQLELNLRLRAMARQGALALRSNGGDGAEAASMAMRGSMPGMAGGQFHPAPAPTPIAQRVGTVRSGLLSARLDLPAPVTLRSGAAPRRVLAVHSELGATVEHQVAPRVSSSVYLAARMHNANPFPLLAGNVALFVDRDYVGTTNIAATPIEEELMLPFGVDSSVTIDRTPGERTTELVAGRAQSTLHYAYRLSNHHDRATTVTVLDQIPISHSAGLTVRTTADSRAFSPRRDTDAPGVVRWVMNLAQNATERWSLGLNVSHPARRTMNGELE